eukprot:6392993-Amphidinium_carterae.1
MRSSTEVGNASTVLCVGMGADSSCKYESPSYSRMFAIMFDCKHSRIQKLVPNCVAHWEELSNGVTSHAALAA